VACWEGKSYLLTIDNFVQYAYNEAAEALLSKLAAEGFPPGLFLQHVERELQEIQVKATPQAVAADSPGELAMPSGTRERAGPALSLEHVPA
jgi:hypothetical protein